MDSETPRRRAGAYTSTPSRAPSVRGSARTPSRAGASTPSRHHERPFEIGDAVKFEGSSLTGVLRYLGPVQGREGTFAGLELTGSSYGQGKNDGTIDAVQYFATTPNNGVFGPASKLVHLHSARPTSATARPLSSLSGRHSRADGRASRTDSNYESNLPPPPPPPPPSATRSSSATAERARRRMSGVPVPVPSPAPRTTPRKSLGGSAAMRPAPTRPAHGFATPQVHRTVSSPRRPTSSVGYRRPASVLHRSVHADDDGFVFDDAPRLPPAPAPASPKQRQGLLEQLALPLNDGNTSLDEAVIPMAVYERLCDELADVRRQCTSLDRERTEVKQTTQKREQEWEETKRIAVEEEVKQRQALEAQVQELQHKLHEAIDTATAAADAHDELEHAASEHAKRIQSLETDLAAMTIRAEQVANKDDAGDVAALQAKMDDLVQEWQKERLALQDQVDTWQAKHKATEQQLETAKEAHATWQAKVDELEAQVAHAQQGDTSATQSAAEIEMASLREQLQHAHDKVGPLEDELTELRASLDRERAAHQASASAHAEALKKWQEQQAAVQEQVTQWQETAQAAEKQVQSLQQALDECQAALERERAEIEALREAPATPHMASHTPQLTQGTSQTEAETIRALEARLAQVEREKAEEHAHFTKEIAELESLVESRIFREDELETELEQLRAKQEAT